MQTWHIHIEGQVQGVGFRPFVYLLANSFNLNGWVNNSIDGVHIEVNATAEVAKVFYNSILQNAPILAQITNQQLKKTKQKFFDDFQIVQSHSTGKTNLLLTPDFAMCGDCKQELLIKNNQRFDYPFITCTNCGPRYSIIQSLPYDRDRTTMNSFEICQTCRMEYNTPTDRRYYSQTNSCMVCGIQMNLFDNNQNKITDETNRIISLVETYWRQGKIVAIKGIGGYLLTCDAENEKAILELRKRKHRPTKPFALLFPNLNSLAKEAILDQGTQSALQYPVSPIVLFDLKEKNYSYLAKEAISPNLNQIGVMLPYTPLFELLLNNFGKPIVATSGNISNAPIVFEDSIAITNLSSIADYILTNNRQIVVPQDDSVLKFSPFLKEKIVIRRSRGLAPTYIHPVFEFLQETILATGAMLKSTFCFLHQQNTFISQYLGDLANFETQQNYEHTLQHFLRLFKEQPVVILVDKHPEYDSTQLGKRLAEEWKIPTQNIQHHIAHFGAIIGEHNLVEAQHSILGVIWDGIGLGNDDQIWGGEFFKYENYEFLRCNYFDYFDFILGDKMPKEPRISALSACWDIMGMEHFLKDKFTEIEWNIYTKILTKKNPLKTSSVGRIFDGVAALLGIMDKQTYEGEAAMQLEALATSYFKKNGLHFSSSYFLEGTPYDHIPTKSLMTNIIMDLQKGKPKDFIAAKFHFSLMKLIKIIANNLRIKKIAFSGGVFQNGLLVDLIIYHLSKEFKLYFHQQLSPNDENISFGQLVCYQIAQKKHYTNG